MASTKHDYSVRCYRRSFALAFDSCAAQLLSPVLVSLIGVVLKHSGFGLAFQADSDQTHSLTSSGWFVTQRHAPVGDSYRPASQASLNCSIGSNGSTARL